MAVTAALPFARGPLLRLWALRLAFVLAAALPAWMGARSGIESGIASQPYFVGGANPLPIATLARIAMGLPSSIGPLLALAAFAMLIADQLLTAAALLVVDGRVAEPRRIVREAGRDGARYVYRFVRIVLWTLVAGAGGAGLLGFALGRIASRGREAGWTHLTTDLVLPIVIACACTLWLSIVAAWGLWTRVVTVVADRRCTRRSAGLVLRAWRRRPGAALAVWLLLLVPLVPAPLLLLWRNAGPWSRGAVFAFVVLGTLLQALLAALWLWLLVFVRARLKHPALDTLWSTPDAPHRPVRRSIARWRERRAARSAPPEAPSDLS